MGYLHSFIGQIHTAFIRHKRNQRLIQECADYLRDGDYISSISYDTVYNRRFPPHLNTDTFTAQRNKLFPLSKIIIRFFNVFFDYKVHHGNNQAEFNGTEIIVSTCMTENKIFDFQKNQVLTTYQSKSKLLKIDESKHFFVNTFNVPTTLDINVDRSYLIEEFIPHSEYDVEMVFRQLCNDICRHLDYFSSKIFYNADYYEEACKHFESRFGTNGLIREKVGDVMVLSHGDLWSSNIIYNENKVYITDFEHVGDRFFLYDFFMFIFTEWQLKENDRLVVNYFGGYYDEVLCQMFYKVGLNYDNKRKNNYFMAFIVSILYERWQGYEIINEKIQFFINKYISHYSN